MATPDPEVAAVAAAFPQWQVFRSPVDGLLGAWLPDGWDPSIGGLVVLYAADAKGLIAALEAYRPPSP